MGNLCNRKPKPVNLRQVWEAGYYGKSKSNVEDSVKNTYEAGALARQLDDLDSGASLSQKCFISWYHYSKDYMKMF